MKKVPPIRCPYCSKNTTGKGKCGSCRRRTIDPAHSSRSTKERFESKLEKINDGCWMWNGSKNKSGYGVFRFHGKSMLAHRASWLIFVGVPTKQICHHCDVPACVNPQHLYDADQSTNLKDMVRRGRRRYDGEFNVNHLLTRVIIREAKRLHDSGKTYVEIAAMIGCAESTISHACSGGSWKEHEN